MTKEYWFNKRVSARLTEDERDQIELICRILKGKYSNLSHFVRCAVIKLIREELDEIRRIQLYKKHEVKNENVL